MTSGNSNSRIKVALVEDRKEFRERLVALINSAPEFTCVAACAGPENLLDLLLKAQPDVILLDIDLNAALTGIDLIRPLKSKLPKAEIVMLTSLEQTDLIFQAVCRGASGYLRRSISPAQLLEAIQDVRHGGSPMSPDVNRLVLRSFQNTDPNEAELQKLSLREREILEYLAQGYEPKEVAQTLGTQYDTVKGQIRSIREKLEVRTHESAVKKAYPHKEYQSTVRRIENGGMRLKNIQR